MADQTRPSGTDGQAQSPRRVGLPELRAMMLAVCARRAVPTADRAAVVDHFLEGELRGKTTHGIGKFCFESEFFDQRRGSPVVVEERPTLVLVDGNREIGPTTARFCTDLATQRARQYGTAIVGVVNTQRYGVLSTWTERIARAGLFGLVTNTSTADAAPTGIRRPVLGVNPISVGVPADPDPYIIDLGTTVSPMGTFWDAQRRGVDLPPGAFLDDSGAATTDPEAMASALVFGGYKGLALSILVQVLNGSFFGFAMGSGVQSVWDTGYVFMAVDCSLGAGLDGTVAGVTSLVADLNDASSGADSAIPGQNGTALRTAAIARGWLTVEEDTLVRLENLSR